MAMLGHSLHLPANDRILLDQGSLLSALLLSQCTLSPCLACDAKQAQRKDVRSTARFYTCARKHT